MATKHNYVFDEKDAIVVDISVLQQGDFITYNNIPCIYMGKWSNAWDTEYRVMSLGSGEVCRIDNEKEIKVYRKMTVEFERY